MSLNVKTTLYLPEELHISAKIEAAMRRITMTKLIIIGLEHELNNSASNSKDPKNRRMPPNPLNNYRE